MNISKRRYLVVLLAVLAILFCSNAHAGWSKLNLAPLNDLKDVWTNAPDNVWIVGSSGVVIHYDGRIWHDMSGGLASYELQGVWGTSAEDVWVAGYGGVFQFDGTIWREKRRTSMMYDIWGNSGTDIYAVGSSGKIQHYNGSEWDEAVLGDYFLQGVWGSSEDDIFVVGYDGADGVIFHSDGIEWSRMTAPATGALYDVWGTSANNVFAVGTAGTILNYNGTDWKLVNSGTVETLWGIWGSSEEDIFAVGSNGTILHFNGTRLYKMKSGTQKGLAAVCGSSPTDVYAVGWDGNVLHYDGRQEGCLAVSIYGDDSAEAKLLRTFRDTVLSKTPEGNTIIKLYYAWSPILSWFAERDEKFRQQIQTIMGRALIKLRKYQ